MKILLLYINFFIILLTISISASAKSKKKVKVYKVSCPDSITIQESIKGGTLKYFPSIKNKTSSTEHILRDATITDMGGSRRSSRRGRERTRKKKVFIQCEYKSKECRQRSCIVKKNSVKWFKTCSKNGINKFKCKK